MVEKQQASDRTLACMTNPLLSGVSRWVLVPQSQVLRTLLLPHIRVTSPETSKAISLIRPFLNLLLLQHALPYTGAYNLHHEFSIKGPITKDLRETEDEASQ